jgi:hypothetical protein
MAIEVPRDRIDEYRARQGAIRLLSIPRHRFVMVDGTGPPVPEAFEIRMPALYTTAYGLRFALKRRGVPGKVGPLEGLWWQADGGFGLDEILSDDRSGWRWTLMLVLPDDATDDEIDEQLPVARRKLPDDVAASVRAEWFEEGDVAQVLHVGPERRRTPLDRPAPCRHRSRRLHTARASPRDLPWRSTSECSRTPAHDPSPADRSAA